MTTRDPLIYRPSDLARALGVAQSTIWRWRRRGEIPPPVRLPGGVTGWLRSDIERWLSERREAPVGEAQG